MAAQSVSGNRNQSSETQLNPQNVVHLAPKWTFTLSGSAATNGVSATPTVSADGAVYFPAWDGYLYAVNDSTGTLIWKRQISSYEPDSSIAQWSRDSPLILGNELIFGDNAGGFQPQGAHMFAVNRTNGNLIWSTQIDSNGAAFVTSSPVNVGNEVVVGVASNEEADAESASYPCCTFRGAVVALDATTGHLLWKTYTVPSNNPNGGDSNLPCAQANPASGCGFTGGAVWATPTIDTATNQVFVGTGNNYTATDSAASCANNDLNQSPPADDSGCTPSNDYFDSVLALNLQTGAIEWGKKMQGYDAWNVACLIGYQPGTTWCPSPQSPDYDFGGSSPNLFTGNHGEKLVGDGQKSGEYWAFDEATGALVWNRLVGPGSSLGGLEWGSAFDGHKIYTAEANPFGSPYTLSGGQSSSGGSWAGLDPTTGAFDWQTGVPGGYAALGPVSSADGIVFGGSMAPDDPSADGASDPNMFALDGQSGKILWSFPAGGSVNDGPAIADGVVYWGSGYGHLGIPGFSGSNKFYAFSVNGK